MIRRCQRYYAYFRLSCHCFRHFHYASHYFTLTPTFSFFAAIVSIIFADYCAYFAFADAFRFFTLPFSFDICQRERLSCRHFDERHAFAHYADYWPYCHCFHFRHAFRLIIAIYAAADSLLH
jgi:hypothetical protein